MRITGLALVLFIRDRLRHLSTIEVTDVGCGAGRYGLEMFEYLDEKLHLICLDENQNMLHELNAFLRGRGIENFTTIDASATKLPLSNKLKGSCPGWTAKSLGPPPHRSQLVPKWDGGTRAGGSPANCE